jgi:hypothetical protein
MKNMVYWTNKYLDEKGKTRITLADFYFYLGIKLYMSFVQLPRLVYYWGKDIVGTGGLVGQVMSQNRFLKIRGAMQFHPKRAVLYRSQD